MVLLEINLAYAIDSRKEKKSIKLLCTSQTEGILTIQSCLLDRCLLCIVCLKQPEKKNFISYCNW